MMDAQPRQESPAEQVQDDELLIQNADSETGSNAGNPTPAPRSWACHPDESVQKMLALVLMCLLGFGSYFCFDNPGALQNEIREVMNVSTFKFATLYSWYSWPNVVLPIFGGYLIDAVLGLRVGAAFYSATLIVGQALVAYGAYKGLFGLMEIGRFVFGIGGESLAVAQNTYAAAWFSGVALNMVFGLQLSVARVGSTVNFQVMEPLYDHLLQNHSSHDALGMSLAIAGAACLLSFIAALILGFMDKRRFNYLRIESTSDEKLSLLHLRYFRTRFWLICLICVCYYVTIFPFVSLAQVFYIQKYSMTNASANFVNGLIYLISAFASPLFGMLIDLVGRNITFVLVAILGTVVGHSLLALTLISPYVPVVVLGLSYSLLASALWPMVTFVVPAQGHGTAFGVMQAVQNLGLATITLAAGAIVDHSGYIWLELFFLGGLVLALVCTLLLWIIDGASEEPCLNLDSASGKARIEHMRHVLALDEERRRLQRAEALPEAVSEENGPGNDEDAAQDQEEILIE